MAISKIFFLFIVSIAASENLWADRLHIVSCERLLERLGVNLGTAQSGIIVPRLDWPFPQKTLVGLDSLHRFDRKWLIKNDLTGVRFEFVNTTDSSDEDLPVVSLRFQQSHADQNRLWTRLKRDEFGRFLDLNLFHDVVSFLYSRLEPIDEIQMIVNDPQLMLELNEALTGYLKSVDSGFTQVDKSAVPGRLDPTSEAFIDLHFSSSAANFLTSQFRTARLRRVLDEAWRHTEWAKLIALSGWQTQIEIQLSRKGIFYETPGEAISYWGLEDYMSNVGGDTTGGDLRDLLVFQYKITLSKN